MSVQTYTPLPSAWKAAFAQRLLERMLQLEPLESLSPATRKIEARRRREGVATDKARAARR